MSLVVWLPLNGNLNNQGLSDVTVTNSGMTVNNSGIIGQCYTTTADGNGIVLSDYMNDLKTYTEYSMCAWIYMNSAATSHSSTILSSGNWNTSNGNCCFGLYNYSDGYANLLIPNRGAWSTSISLPSKVLINKWYHITVTYNGTKTTAYINGEYVGQSSSGGICENSNSTNLKIGAATYTNGFTLKGKINDVRIYDHCLSDKEVKEISKGLVFHYKLDELSNNNILPLGYQQLEYIESSGTSYFDTGLKFNPEVDGFEIIYKGNDLTNNGMILSSGSSSTYFWLYYYSSNGTRIYANNGDGQQYVVGFPQDSLVHRAEWKNKHLYADYVDKGTITNTYSNTNGNLWLCSYGGNTTSYSFKGRIYYASIYKNGEYARIFIPAKRLSDAAVGMYEFITDTFYTSSNVSFAAGPAINSTISIADVSGYRYDGTAYGNLSVESSEARYKFSTKFGDSKYIAPSIFPSFLTNEATVSMWVKLDQLPPSSPGRTMLYTAWYGFSCEITSAGKTYFRTYLSSGQCDSPQGTITTGNWVHWVGVKSSTGVSLYLNGELIGTTSNSNNFNWSSNASNKIAAYSTSYFLYGNLSDVRLYATALSAEDILELYHTAASVDNTGNLFAYQLNEV